MRAQAGDDPPGVRIADAPDFPDAWLHARRQPRPRPDAGDPRPAGRVVRPRPHQPPRALHRAHLLLPRPRGRLAGRVADDRRRRAAGSTSCARRTGSSSSPTRTASGTWAGGSRTSRTATGRSAPTASSPSPGTTWSRGARADAGQRGVRADPVRGAAAQLPVAAVNIGCDETFELGHGVSRNEVARVGKERGLRRPPAPHRRAPRGRRLRGPLLGRHRAQGPGARRRAARDRDAGVLDLRGARPRCAPARGARGPAGRARLDLPTPGASTRTPLRSRGRRAVLGRAGHVGMGLARRPHRQRGRQPRRRGRGRPGAARGAT